MLIFQGTTRQGNFIIPLPCSQLHRGFHSSSQHNQEAGKDPNQPNKDEDGKGGKDNSIFLAKLAMWAFTAYVVSTLFDALIDGPSSNENIR